MTLKRYLLRSLFDFPSCVLSVQTNFITVAKFLKPFYVNSLFLNSLKRGLLLFSKSTERDQKHEMGWKAGKIQTLKNYHRRQTSLSCFLIILMKLRNKHELKSELSNNITIFRVLNQAKFQNTILFYVLRNSLRWTRLYCTCGESSV